MRKMELQQVEDILKLLIKVHIQIKTAAENNRMQEVQSLLSKVRDAARELRSFIELKEGADCGTVMLLAEYVQSLCQLIDCFRENEYPDSIQLYKKLSSSLLQIENSIPHSIRLQKEIVFLPYKASMWDSLESVWRKACADPDCTAFVIPIPYFDKNPDGSFGEMHYEASEYPDDVPVISYEEYDFAQRRPDAIYIHNPYDECNYVTSVPPFFYSENLLQFTERLVYIPYFVLDEPDPHNPAALEGISHFVVMPGVVHADQVIVQSENMRLAYIEILTKQYGEHTRSHWEQKISGEGSPKFEKLKETVLDDSMIPQDWKPFLFKQDGSRKKIILYNTSISALLRHNEAYLEKMKRVFGIFQENKDEVALLWRPHPLIQATISSMRPQLWEEYQKLKDEYCRKKWGIYDDSSDLDRAIVLSDAYYGDGSSLIQLCKQANIPIMIQNVYV